MKICGQYVPTIMIKRCKSVK